MFTLLTGLLLAAPCPPLPAAPVLISEPSVARKSTSGADRGLELLLLPSGQAAGCLDLMCRNGSPGQVLRLVAAPEGGGAGQAQPIARLTMDGTGTARIGLPLGLSAQGGFDLIALPEPDALLFGAQVAGMVSLPAQGGATGVLLPKPGVVLISEIHKDPSAVSDSQGEWLEFYNTTAQPIDIEGWILSDLGSDATVLDNAGAGILVPARGYAVVARQLDITVNGGVDAAAAYSQFTLSNGDDEVVLSRPNGLLVDEVRYDDASWPDIAGATLQLSNVRLGPLWNDDPAHWCAGTQVYGDGDLGTPGVKNDDC